MRDFSVPSHRMQENTIRYGQRAYKSGKAKTAHSPFLLPALFFLFIMSLLCYIWTRIQVVQYGYEISSALRAKEAAVIARNERTIEMATLRSAQQVEKRAREELMMSHPRKDQLVIMR